MKTMQTAALLLAMIGAASATVYYEDTFGDDWASRWVQSTSKEDEGARGDFTLTAGKWHGEDAEAAKGIQTGPDARFFAYSSKMPKVFNNAGKDLVLQFSVKHEQSLDCGGGYIKLMGGDLDQKTFNGDSEYAIMFGPDICGYSTKRVHVIFNYKGENHLIKETIACETDELTHVYTLIVRPDNSYSVLIDNEEKATGSLKDDWDMLKPKTIPDPEASKPEDWDERAMIPDESDVKPEGYDEIPAKIPDPDAAKPEDWDDEDDGEWEAPMIPNADFKGPWVQKQIENPDYKGIWKPDDIANPEFVDDDNLYQRGDMKHVGFELWQVKAGTIFDNVLVTDDAEYAKDFATKTWGAAKDAEKAMFDEIKKVEAEEEEAARAAAEAEMADQADEEDEYEDAEGEEAHDEL